MTEPSDAKEAIEINTLFTDSECLGQNFTGAGEDIVKVREAKKTALEKRPALVQQALDIFSGRSMFFSLYSRKVSWQVIKTSYPALNVGLFLAQANPPPTPTNLVLLIIAKTRSSRTPNGNDALWK